MCMQYIYGYACMCISMYVYAVCVHICNYTCICVYMYMQYIYT